MKILEINCDLLKPPALIYLGSKQWLIEYAGKK